MQSNYPSVTLGDDLQIGVEHPCVVVAECCNNSNGDMGYAREQVHAAADAGASAVKFQLRDRPRPGQKGVLTRENLEELAQLARGLYGGADESNPFAARLSFGCTVFATNANWREELSWAADVGDFVKVGSAENNNTSFIAHAVAAARDFGVPMFYSTGGLAWRQIMNNVEFLVSERRSEPLVVMHCVSKYPCPLRDAMIHTVNHWQRRFGDAHVIGYSDHTGSPAAMLAAALLGASVIETHFTLRHSDEGTNVPWSITPVMLGNLVEEVDVLARSGHRVEALPGELEVLHEFREGVVE